MAMDVSEQTRRAQSSFLCRALIETASVLKTGKGAHDKELFPKTVFADPKVTVITEDEGDIDTMIAAKLGKLGLCATIMLSDADTVSPNIPVLDFRTLRVTVEICEKAITNRGQTGTGVTALEAAEQAARLLHGAHTAEGLHLGVENVVKYATPPKPADNCYHIRLVARNNARIQ